LKAKDYIELEQKYGAHNYHPLPVVISRAKESGSGTSMEEVHRYAEFLFSDQPGHLNDRIVKAAVDNFSGCP